VRVVYFESVLTSKPMRFLILTLYYPPEIGAAPTRLDAMASELARIGHSVEVVTAMPNYPHGTISPEYRGSFYRREIRGRIVIHRLLVYPTLGSGLGRMLNYLSFSISSIVGLFRAAKPDFVFVESPPPTLTLPAYVYSLIRQVPFIVNVADLWPDTLIDMGLLKRGFLHDLLARWEKWSYRRASFVNAITEGVRDTLLRVKNVPPDRVLFLPNGVDTERYQPRPSDLAFKSSLGLAGKKVILYAGTLGRAHGLEHVLQAAKLLEKETDFHFLFLGDGSERPALEKLRDVLALPNVTFQDAVQVEQLGRYQSIADCGLVSLRNVPIFEGARPSKMFPLLAAGIPLIYFGSGEGARLIQTANAGVVVAAERPDALAAAIPKLLRDETLVATLGANGRAFVKENHEWSKLIADWLLKLQAQSSRMVVHKDRLDLRAFEQ
jgi:colanic acid biosynthesis glycosyl transferase WcaI